MSGSDWHMMEMVWQTRILLQTFQQLVRDLDWLGQRRADRLFFRNAVDFLNLEGYLTFQDSCGSAGQPPKIKNHLGKVLQAAK